MIEYLLIALYLLSCLVLILFVLLQPGKSDAAAVFGGGASSTAFGPRGTQTVMAKITVGAAISFFLIAFLFSIPGLVGKKSLGRSLGVQPQSSVPPPAPVTPPGDESSPAGAPQTSPSAVPQTSPGAKPQGATPGGSPPAASKSPATSQSPAAGQSNSGTAPAQEKQSPAKK